MRHISTKAIVLSRTNFSEADRILTFITKDNGKVRGLARGVRKLKSKLAGGIELFSVSEISFLVGRSDIYTIASTRLVKHYPNIVKDLDRTNAGYEFIKQINKQTEDQAEEAYFNVLQTAFEALDSKTDLELVKVWFKAQLLKLAGHMPNLSTDKVGRKLSATQVYNFDSDSMSFKPSPSGRYKAEQIKFLRLVFSDNSLLTLQKINEFEQYLKPASLVVGSCAEASAR